jgi:hypothetical protein
MTASTFFRVPTSSLFVNMLAASSNPNKLWSVNTVLMPSRCAWSIASCPNEERLACAWMRWMCSRSMIVRKYGKNVKKFGSVAEDAIGTNGR